VSGGALGIGIANARKKAQDNMRLRRRRRAWELRTEHGWTEVQIAEELEVSQPTIHRDLKWVSNLVVKDLAALAKRTKIEQVAQLQYIIREALTAWEKSKEASKTVTQEKKVVQVDFDGDPREDLVVVGQTTRAVTQTGKREYLETAMRAMDEQLKRLGTSKSLDGLAPNMLEDGGVQVVITLPDNGRGS
jgi:predicted transcriptional regulator